MTQIIVEIGLNHLGSEERAWRMVECAAAPAVDAVTFQIRERKFYENPDPLRRRLRPEFYRRAVAAIQARGQQCGLAIADESAVAEFDGLGNNFWKTLSWDLKNQTLQGALRATGKPVLLSTGLSAMDEIVAASRTGGNLVLIHTQLSEKIEEVNLKAIAEIRRRTGLPVAFGLHCANHDVLQVALGFEPAALLFYLKEDGCGDLFDDQHAIAMSQLRPVTDNLKSLLLALGTGDKISAEKPDWVVH